MLPCAASLEKEGSITNSGRWMQWRYKAVNPPGEAMADGEIIPSSFFKVREHMEKDNAVLKEAFTKLAWEYGPKDYSGKMKAFDTPLRGQRDKRILPRRYSHQGQAV